MLPMPALGGVLGAVKLALIKHAPTLLVAGGTTMLVAATGVAVKKSFTYLDEDLVPYITEAAVIEADEEKDEETKKADLTAAQKKFLVRTAKRYAPVVGLTVAGIACIAAGHTMQMKRLAGLGAALALAEADKKDLLAELNDEVPEPRTETVDGKTEVVRTPQKGHLLPAEDFRNRVFGPENKNWDPSPVVSQNFLNATERHLNDLLRWQGHVFLNEVYKALGMPQTRLGGVMGWSRKADPDAVILFSALEDQTGFADGYTEEEQDKIKTIWHLDLEAPHNLLA
nr:MAG TPA: hypothetical protein [Caudoviricetes sp.]